MMSTNNFEKLDSALIRPGRIDCAIHFQKCNKKNTKKLLENYFEEEIVEEDFQEKKWTPAQIFQICSKTKNLKETLQILN